MYDLTSSVSHLSHYAQDLKADNILVERQGTCKISDFGIAKKGEEASTGMKGTVFWMAPEVVGPGKTGYTAKVDIWSMGCVILEMWSGVRPWHGEETIPVMLKVCLGQGLEARSEPALAF